MNGIPVDYAKVESKVAGRMKAAEALLFIEAEGDDLDEQGLSAFWEVIGKEAAERLGYPWGPPEKPQSPVQAPLFDTGIVEDSESWDDARSEYGGRVLGTTEKAFHLEFENNVRAWFPQSRTTLVDLDKRQQFSHVIAPECILANNDVHWEEL